MAYNMFGRCVVKCVCFEELNSMLNYGTPGLSCIPDWAPVNLMRWSYYPAYVSVDLYGEHGIMLFDISALPPDGRLEQVELLRYSDFVQKVK